VVDVDEVDPRRLDTDPDLAGTWRRFRDVLDDQLLGTADLADDDCAHLGSFSLVNTLDEVLSCDLSADLS
jgi:hypothetical protein